VAQLNETDIERYLDDRAAARVQRDHRQSARAQVRVPRAGYAGRRSSPFAAGRMFEGPECGSTSTSPIAQVPPPARVASPSGCVRRIWDGTAETRGFFKEINAAGHGCVAQLRPGSLGERFKDLPNIVWMLGGDFRVFRRRIVGSAMCSPRDCAEGGVRQLMTAHGGQTAAVEDLRRPRLDRGGHGIQLLEGSSRAAAGRARAAPAAAVRADRNRPTKENTTRRPSRSASRPGRRCCRVAAGQFFGNNPIWHFDGPTLFKYEGSWQQALDSVGSRDMARLGTSFDRNAGFELSTRSRRAGG
jgi:hypothetical protein